MPLLAHLFTATGSELQFFIRERAKTFFYTYSYPYFQVSHYSHITIFAKWKSENNKRLNELKVPAGSIFAAGIPAAVSAL